MESWQEMRRVMAFIGIFLIVLLIGYIEPVFFPAENKRNPNATEERIVSHTALPYEELATAGFAKDVGKEVTDFTAKFGSPTEIIQTDFSYEKWVYVKDENYLEVNVKNKKILSITTFNFSEETQPFVTNMTLSDLSEQLTIYSKFTFSYENQKYSIELMEEDMNYRPLVAFDNQTFAIVYFNSATNKLTAITYLTKEMLVSVMPYLLIKGEPLSFPEAGTTNQFDEMKRTQVKYLLNFLRKKEHLSAYSTSTTSQKEAQELSDLFEKNAEVLLSSERFDAWSEKKEQLTVQNTFTLSSDEFKKLLKLKQLDDKKTTGMYTKPVYDTTLTVLSWFSDPLFHSRMSHTAEEEIGIAFSKESMLVLITDQTIDRAPTEDSD